MITLYIRNPQGFDVLEWNEGVPFPSGVLWADLDNTTPNEEAVFQAFTGIPLPSREDEWKNEVLNRMYQAENISYMTAALISKSDGPHPVTKPVTFVLTEECLVTLRDIAPTSFSTFAKRMVESPRHFNSGPEIMEGLLGEMVMRVAHNSEIVVDELDELSHLIFDPYGIRGDEESTSHTMGQALRRLGGAADLNSKVDESLHSFARLLAFLKEVQEDNQYLARKLDVHSADVKELLQQSAFLADKITFQLDATLGMINVEQNVIMKILSVFTVIIMPPTLIGSIYGMNFQHMPELGHAWGYPLALVLMLVCSVGPYLYFRHKKWL